MFDFEFLFHKNSKSDINLILKGLENDEGVQGEKKRTL